MDRRPGRPREADDERRRIVAAELIGDIRDPSYVPDLILMLREDCGEGLLSGCCFEAFERIGHRLPIEPIAAFA